MTEYVTRKMNKNDKKTVFSHLALATKVVFLLGFFVYLELRGVFTSIMKV